MAQPQPQYQMAPQASPSPANSVNGFPLPPNKRQKTSPQPPSQPGSPYIPVQQSPYGMSPGASTPQSASASPHFGTVHLPQGVYNTPYTNGQTTPTLNLPQSNVQPYQPPYNFPSPNQNQTQSNHQPNANYMMPPQGHQVMGPPLKPAEKSKEDGLDPMDILGGTGIDLREEEQYTWQLTSKSFNSQQSGSQSGTISSGNSFTQFPPGDERSFYGAGPANAAAEIPNTKSQEEYHRRVVDTAWNRAAHDLAVSRQRELDNPFLAIAMVTHKMDKIARENGLTLKKDGNGTMGTMKLPSNFQSSNLQPPSVNVQTAVGPNGAITLTSGNFVPADSLLVDHVALLSISTKHRLRGLLEDATRLAKGRITGSHGAVPEEWKDVAVPARITGGSDVAPGSGWESAVSPRSNPLKRSLSMANRFPTPVSDGAKTPTINPIKFTNEVISALRKSAAKERDFEEKRLKKRRDRQEGVPTASRSGSVIPGTPGSVAPEPIEKAPTKKEQTKKAQAKKDEAINHIAANQTTNQFLAGGKGMFGKKKYSWLNSGSGSGTSTPAKLMTQGLPGTPSGPVEPVAEPKLTHDGVRRLGTWRENSDKGAGIQIRDWISALEQDGREKQALQRAYATLDDSQPK